MGFAANRRRQDILQSRDGLQRSRTSPEAEGTTESESLLEHSLRIKEEEHYGLEHHEVAVTLSNLGNACGSLRNHQKQPLTLPVIYHRTELIARPLFRCSPVCLPGCVDMSPRSSS